MALEMLLFAVVIIAFGALALIHKNISRRMHFVFLFGFLVNILYALLYVLYQQITLTVIVALIDLAIVTQYLHIRAVRHGTTKPTKMIVDLEKNSDLEKTKIHKAKN